MLSSVLIWLIVGCVAIVAFGKHNVVNSHIFPEGQSVTRLSRSLLWFCPSLDHEYETGIVRRWRRNILVENTSYQHWRDDLVSFSDLFFCRLLKPQTRTVNSIPAGIKRLNVVSVFRSARRRY